MKTIKLLLISGIITTASLSAGQIQIGGANGLTSSYITGNGGSATGWSERNYVTSLFEAATVTPSGTNTNTLPGQTGNPGVNTMTDANGVVFNMINDGPGSGASNNIWASVNGGAAGAVSITIPVNVFGATSVYLLLNDYYGFAGENATISFNFASGADVINLAYSADGTGAIRSAINCTGSTAPSITCPGNQTMSTSNTVSSSSPLVSNTNYSGDATIKTSAIWAGTYTLASSGGVANPYKNATAGTSGNLLLDELAFSFSSNYANTTLNSITITTAAANVTGESRLALSAVTVSTTPEPSTMGLIAAGIGLLGFGRLRRRS